MTERRGVIATLRAKLGERSAERKAVKAWVREHRLTRDKEVKGRYWIDAGHYVDVQVHDPVARETASATIAAFRHDIAVGSLEDDEDRAEKMAERKARRLKMEKKGPAEKAAEPAASQAARATAVVDRLAGVPKASTGRASVADRLIGAPGAAKGSRAPARARGGKP